MNRDAIAVPLVKKIEELTDLQSAGTGQRQFRQRARQVMVAHSEKGAEANLELVIYHRNLASPTADTLSWGHRLEEALLAA